MAPALRSLHENSALTTGRHRQFCLVLDERELLALLMLPMFRKKLSLGEGIGSPAAQSQGPQGTPAAPNRPGQDGAALLLPGLHLQGSLFKHENVSLHALTWHFPAATYAVAGMRVTWVTAYTGSP